PMPVRIVPCIVVSDELMRCARVVSMRPLARSFQVAGCAYVAIRLHIIVELLTDQEIFAHRFRRSMRIGDTFAFHRATFGNSDGLRELHYRAHELEEYLMSMIRTCIRTASMGIAALAASAAWAQGDTMEPAAPAQQPAEQAYPAAPTSTIDERKMDQ